MIIFVRYSEYISGAENYNLYLLNSLSDKQKKNCIFYSPNPTLNKKLRDIGVKTIHYNALVKESGTKKEILILIMISIAQLINYLFSLHKFVITSKRHTFVIQSYNEKILLSPLVKLFRHKIVFLEHGPFFNSQRAKVSKILYKFASWFADKILVVSDDTKNDLLSYGIREKKIYRKYIGVSTDYFKPLSSNKKKTIKKKLGIDLSEKVLGYIGGVNAQKGIYEYIKVAKIMLKYDKKIHFLIVGGGVELKHVIKSVKKTRLNEHLTFTGNVADVREFVGVFDLALIPTKHKEGISLAILETMSMGCPVLTTSLGGNKEVVKNNVNGFIYDELPANVLARKTLKHIKSSNVKSIRKNARDTIVSSFNIRLNGEKIYSSL